MKLALVGDAAKVSIDITDDGEPFLIREHLRSSAGMGIKNIYSRLNYIGALLHQHPQNSGNHLQIIIKFHHA